MNYKNEIRFIITNKCNYDCIFCHNEGVSKACAFSKQVTSEDYCYITDVTSRCFGIEKFVLTGGEPLLRKENGLKIKRLDTIPLYKDRVFEKGRFLNKYPGADVYMKGRISIPNFTTENRQESIETAYNYINLFKTLLK